MGGPRYRRDGPALDLLHTLCSGPATVEQLCYHTGRRPQRVADSLQSLHRRQCVSREGRRSLGIALGTEPWTYRITPAGRALLADHSEAR